MNRHVSAEELSAYIDSELGFAEMLKIDAHCAACAECGSQLAALRRVVTGLGQVERAAPPAFLHHQIRRQAMAAPPVGRFRRALESLRLLLFPAQPSLRAAAGLGLALVVGLYAYGNIPPGPPEPQPRREIVMTYPGAHFDLQTTSEVAGREFVLTEVGWIQKGLEGKAPQAHLDSHSPQGRALLTRLSDLDLLLKDGSAVVLRYNLETVEISSRPSSRILGYGTQARPEAARHLEA